MGSFGTMKMLCLLMLVTFTSTWASSSDRREVVIASRAGERHEGPIRRYQRKEIDGEAMIKSHEDNGIAESLIRRYLRSETDGYARFAGRYGRKSRRSLRSNEEDKDAAPFSTRRFEKMLEKAILKIITGDLSTADMVLLKSLNYSLEEVLAIRERELGKKIREPQVPKPLRVGHWLDSTKMDREVIEGGRSLTESPKDSEENAAERIPSRKSKKRHEKPAEDTDFDAYNRQAVYDYENAANKISSQQSELDPLSSIADYEDHSRDVEQPLRPEAQDDVHTNFNRAMEPHVVFKIRYDDSEFDSTSDERARQLSKERRGTIAGIKAGHRNLVNQREPKDKTPASHKSASWSSSKLSSSGANRENKPFQSSPHLDPRSPVPLVHRLGNSVTPHEETTQETTSDRSEPMETSGRDTDIGIKDVDETSSSTLESDKVQVDLLVKNESSDEFRGSGLYEGLEWVEDDVYRVIPQAIDALNYDSIDNDLENGTLQDSEGSGNRTSDLESRMLYDDRNDTSYQNDDPEDDGQSQQIRTNSSTRMPLNSLSTYQQLALAHRKDQGQKAIEDIKLKVLAMTGRYNLSSNSNQVQRERLTMFSPTCQAPKNTDPETWADPFAMNMYFQLNLTSGEHVVAAKMRIYKLPQTNVTVPSNTATVDEEDDEEKKIRISIYFYTKSLKKHRSKKRLMDSVVTALTSQGGHLALDVRQAIRFWRQNLRTSTHANSNNNNNNHGLVIQVEDQDGRPLKPSQYIQQGSCHTSEPDEDDKAYQRVPALFIQACSRYVRVVNGEAVTYVNCSKSLRNDRH